MERIRQFSAVERLIGAEGGDPLLLLARRQSGDDGIASMIAGVFKCSAEEIRGALQRGLSKLTERSGSYTRRSAPARHYRVSSAGPCPIFTL
jgi:hypothetical protein